MNAHPLTLGTAGHIDHGKTRLVEALTGTNTDRLPEERARGISIELGYAVLELPGGRRLSVVDVPGHERFVRTMVAGATGIDLFLLVVDAREGPRAQTHEHLAILRMLGVTRGVVAVTKLDAATGAQVESAVAAVRELGCDAELVLVSAITGAGLPQLVAALERVAGVTERPARIDAPRLYVDRAFSVPGTGTVATGTLWSGAISVGDRLQVLPAGVEARVRSVQVHGTPVERADSGQRVAVGLVLDRRRRLERGDVLVTAGAYPVSYRLDVVLEGADAVAHGARVQVCHGTGAVPARVVRVGESYAQLRLERPIVAARGDHVVLWRATTVGGGRVLDPAPPRRVDEDRLRLLDGGDPTAVLTALVHAPVRLEALRARALLDERELAEALGALRRVGSWVFAPAWLEAMRLHAAAALAARDGEVDPGLPASALLGDEPWAYELAPLLELEQRNGKLYVPGRLPSAGARGVELAEQLTGEGFEPIRVADGTLALQLEREGRLVRLGRDLAIGPAAYERARSLLMEECERAGTISLARFRDLLGASRRVAQLLLERFDADRLTIRVGDERRLRRSALRR